MDDSRHVGAWVGACFFAALAVAEWVLLAASVARNLRYEGQDWQANHAQHQADLHAILLLMGCMAGGAVLALLLTLIPRSSPPSTAGRALAMSAGAFFGGFVLIAYGVVWALEHMVVVY